MSEATTINWPGKSGTQYKYWIHPIGTSFKEVPGNYIYAKETSTGGFVPCYIGQTENLGNRLSNHEKETCAKKNGATHIHAHTSGDGDQTRQAEEEDLIFKWQPPCNDQHVA